MIFLYIFTFHLAFSLSFSKFVIYYLYSKYFIYIFSFNSNLISVILCFVIIFYISIKLNIVNIHFCFNNVSTSTYFILVSKTLFTFLYFRSPKLDKSHQYLMLVSTSHGSFDFSCISSMSVCDIISA